MGFLIIKDPITGKVIEVLGDENEARKAEGLPHYDRRGNWRSQRDLDETDKMGE